MRILLINRYFYPDYAPTGVLLSDLAFALSQRGIHVTVITSRLRYDGRDDGRDPLASSHETIHGVDIYRVWSSAHGRSGHLGRGLDYGSFYLASAWRLWRLARGADIILAESDPPLLSVIVGVIARLRGARAINWLQDIFPEVAEALHVGGGVGTVAFRLIRPLRNWSLHAATANVVVGESMAAQLQNQGVKRTCVISNWSDGALIAPIPASQNALRERWGLKNSFVVGYAGNLGRAHDIGTIIDAMTLLNARADRSASEDMSRRIVFVFIGGGAQHAKLRREVRERQLTNVQIHPYQPQERLSETLGVADLHLVSLNPSLEGFIVPSKFYGIAAAGRPTLFIGAREGEIARLLEECGCGFAVAPGDPNLLVEQIIQLSSNPALCARMGARARNAFERHWDKKIALAQWSRILGLKADQTQ